MRCRKKVPIGFQTVFFVLGMLYLLILPPFTAPDEAGHFATAYHYANVLSGGADSVVESTAGNVYRQIAMREQDAVLYGRLAACGEKQSYAVLTAALKDLPFFSVENVRTTQCLCRTMPYIFPLYIPAVAAILLCQSAGLGSVVMVYLARFLTFLTAWYMICRALQKIPAGGRILQVIALFPMALHLYSSCSADAIANATAVYGSAIILRYRQVPARLQRSDGILLAVLLTVVTLSKPFYILFPALGLLMPQGAFVRKRSSYMFCLIPLLCWLWKYLPIVRSCFLEGDVSAYADLAQGYSAGYILAHPIEIMCLLVRSVGKELPYVAAQSIGLYLGPLTIRIPSAALVVFTGLLVWAVFDGGDGQQILSKKQRILPVLLFGFTYLCCYGMNLLWWTPFGADRIEGMQGRYLLPLMGMLCVAVKPVGQKRQRVGTCAVLSAEALTHIYVLIAVFRQLV
ncbi:MAG: DUF2142 domain-containing protein [Lachnospiraceae bacterium]|nr:DUF2142 domain-containing protein [Lachnospiraceae bacterium]